MRPAPSPITLPNSEIATIDIDSIGRMWLATESSNDIVVYYSDSPYSSWNGPISLASGVSSDDISVVTAMPGGIGVLWSNQSSQRFGFRMHVDGADPATWSADEVPASQSALSVGAGMADDHVNVAVASDGTLCAAVKTSYDSSGTVTIGLLVRRPDGTWDDLYDVADGGETRPMVQLNETTGTVLVAYTGGSSILYEESPVSVIDFGGSGGTLISGGGNNASGMKDNFSDELVVISSDGSNLYGVLCTSATPTLVAHYEMEEDGGTTLVDSSTYGNNGTISGSPTWVAGVAGLALDLDGSGDYALVPDDASLDIENEITLAAWIKPQKVATQDIVKKLVGNGSEAFEMVLSTNGYAFVEFNGAHRTQVTTYYEDHLDEWVHLAATYHGATVRLYVDGVEEGVTPGVFTISTNDQPLTIGSDSSGGRQFEGQMDDVRVYNRALSAAEIQALVGVTPIHIPLDIGWNLVSFNLQPADTGVASALSSVDGNYDLAYAWDAPTQQWLKYDNVPMSPDTLTDLDEKMGFWIHMTTADTLEVAGNIPTTTDINLDSTGMGWNLVGYPSAVSRDLPGVLQDHGMGEDFSLVYAYHADDSADPWKLFDPTAPAWANDLTDLSPGWGFWVQVVDADHTWDVAYPAP